MPQSVEEAFEVAFGILIDLHQIDPQASNLFNSAADSDPVLLPSVKIQLSPSLNLTHFLSVVDIMGKGVSV